MSNNPKVSNMRESDISLSQKVGKGLIWVSVNTVCGISFQLLSAVLLARLLAPSDFGVMAIVMAIISIARSTLVSGFESALIQKQKKPETFLNTAWTLDLIRCVILFLFVYAVAPLAGMYFDEPRTTQVLRVMSVFFIVQGLRNIGVVYFRKNLEFHKLFIFETLPLLVDVCLAIPLAYILKSYWALVWSKLAMASTACLLSYILHPYKPRLEFNREKIKKLFNFGRWILFSSIIVMLREQGVNMFVGKLFGIFFLGLYERATVFSLRLFTLINRIVWKVAYPSYSQIQHEPAKISKAFLETQQVLAFIIMPMAGAMFVLSNDFVTVFLGPKWIQVVSLIQFFSLHAIVSAITTPVSIACQALGKPYLSTKFSFIGLIILGLIIYPFSKWWGITGTAAAFFTCALATTPFLWITALKLFNLTFLQLANGLLLPILNTIFMLCIIQILRLHIYTVINFSNFILMIVMASVFYLFFSFTFERYFKIGALRIIRNRFF
jgi:lipopolysaccharide exporter